MTVRRTAAKNEPQAMTNDPMQDAPETSGEPPMDELEALRAELEQSRAQSLLERADLENQRKRMARDIDNARRFANEKLLADLLPVFDSMEAGLAAAAIDDPLRAGLELTLKQLHSVAERNGLSEVAPKPGDAFNPEHHNAVSQQPAPDCSTTGNGA